jgi:DNA-binding response OmpR family regulator
VSTPRSTVLVVDDDDGVRKTLREWLFASGFDVLLAPDGNEALDALGQHNVDLVLLDVLMPHKDGIETLAAMQKIAHRPPVIAMSGGGSFPVDRVLADARKFGADAVLRKPFTPDKLMAAVHRFLPP